MSVDTPAFRAFLTLASLVLAIVTFAVILAAGPIMGVLLLLALRSVVAESSGLHYLCVAFGVAVFRMTLVPMSALYQFFRGGR